MHSYNTAKDKLFLREYGRNIQQLVKHAMTIEDQEERTRVAHAIVEIMGHLNPAVKNNDQFKHKIWDHIFAISDYKLQIESPYGPPSRQPPVFKAEKRIEYPQGNISHRHYGKNVMRMISKAADMKDDHKKKAFTEVIGNYMKLVYKNWNRENISDEIIRFDIGEMSDGNLELTEESNLNTLSHSNNRPVKKQTQHKKSNNKNYNSKGGQQRRRNKY